MILVDANILTYAAGGDHPNKRPSLAFLDAVAEERTDAALDAEVLQEVMHRYRALNSWAEGRRVYDLARRVFPVVFPISVEVLDAGRRLLDEHPRLSARDALHAGVVEVHELQGICSYDTDYDAIEWIRRSTPAS